MTLQQLIRNIKTENTQGNLDVEIKAITSDSRQAAPGVCFIAVPGTKTDGHAYIQDTINKGVSAVVCMRIPDNAPNNVAFVVVADTADAIGKIASEFADKTIVTDDNPRNEVPSEIRKMILAGCSSATEIEGRENAIKSAIDNLREGDTLLIAGKGHEDYQLINGEKIHFSDKEVILNKVGL